MSLPWLIGDSDGLGLRRVGRGTPLDRVVVHRAPNTSTMAEDMATFLLSGHGFGVVVSSGRRVTFGTPGEDEGRVTYEIKQAWRGQCLIRRVNSSA